MTGVGHLVSARLTKLPTVNPANPKSSKLAPHSFKIRASKKKKKNSLSGSNKKNSRRLMGDGMGIGAVITFSPSLHDLRLEDLIEDESEKDAQVSVNLCVQKVIYVKPGNEAEPDLLIQDMIRLATSIKDTCSEQCEKSYPTVEYTGGQSTASIDKRSRLLGLRDLQ